MKLCTIPVTGIQQDHQSFFFGQTTKDMKPVMNIGSKLTVEKTKLVLTFIDFYRVLVKGKIPSMKFCHARKEAELNNPHRATVVIIHKILLSHT